MAIQRRGEAQSGERSDPIPNLPVGEHEGRLRYVIDLGMHHNEYKGDVKADVQKLSIGIEIVGETVEIDGEQQPRLLWVNPFNVYFSMTERGKEFALYKVFDAAAEVGKTADWDKVINEPCNVTVIHTQGKNENADRTYDNIGELSPIPSKYKSGVEGGLITNGCTGDAEDEESAATSAMYGLVSWMFEQRLGAKPPAAKPVAAKPPAAEEDDSDIPF